MDTPGSEILFSRDPYLFTKPKLIEVGDYIIRDFQAHVSVPQKQQNLGPYEENDDIINCMEIEDNFDIQITKTGMFLIEFHVPSIFFGNIIGAKGSTRRKIEQDTRTTIKVPRQGESGNIVVTGRNERDVVTAKNRIELVVLQARDKHQLTHFVSIPMVSDSIRDNFEVFKSNLLTGGFIRGLDASIFQDPQKLHLTITPLVLIDEAEQYEAIKALKQCKEDIIDPLFANVGLLKISMQGVEILNDDPTNVDVLYGKVKTEPPKYHDCLQRMADAIAKCLADKGLVRKQYERVKLHVTLINTLFRKTSSEQKQKREPFDASAILSKYKNFHFGEVDLNFVHLSIRFTTSESSYYDALTTIAIK